MRTLALLAFVVGCGSASSDLPRPIVAVRPVPAPVVANVAPQQEVAAQQKDEMVEWVRAKLPEGGSVKRDEHGAIVVTHQGGAKDNVFTVANEYLAISSTYLVAELAKHIATINAIPSWDGSVAGKTITSTRSSGASEIRAGSRNTESRPWGR